MFAGQSTNFNCDCQVFLPITKLCRDTCGYCTFAQPPVPGRRSYMTLPEMLDIAARGAEVGCTEALFTLGVPKASCFLLRRDQVWLLPCWLEPSVFSCGVFMECSKCCTYS